MRRQPLSPLPIDPLLPKVVAALERASSVVLQASPGSGKTTRVPPALFDGSYLKTGDLWVLEPRRLAAKYSARRVSDENGMKLGEEVGYHFRFEKVFNSKTRLLFLTEGMLIRRLMANPRLDGVSVVVLDEFHERHLHTDVAIAFLRHLQMTTRPDLKLVVMSATLDAERIARHLGGSEILTLDLPIHPVELRYREGRDRQYLDDKIFEAVRAALDEPKYPGHMLVFLPGMGEIRRAESRLLDLARQRGFDVLALHGDLSREEQDRALNRSERRKVILSTNVAETSLTIEGVTTVIDSGLHRQASYSAWNNIGSLQTKPVSKASAIQRAGRAGRQSPGLCIRLYAETDFLNRAAFDLPEIQRSDLSQTLLELLKLGADVSSIPWLEIPKKENVDAAMELLLLLKAVRKEGGKLSLTELGNRISEFPAHPRIAAMCIAAESQGVVAKTVRLAARLVDGDPLDLDALSGLSSPANPRTERQLAENLKTSSDSGNFAAVARAVLDGFPDRVARRRSSVKGGWEILLATGGSAEMADHELVRNNEYFVVLDIQEMKSDRQLRAHKKVRSLVVIQPEWLFDLESPLMRETEQVALINGKARAVSTLLYGGIELSSSETQAKDSAAVAKLLLKEALGLNLDQPPQSVHEWIQKLAHIAGEEFQATLTRIDLARRHRGEPALEPRAIADWLTQAATGKEKATELRSIDWEAELIEFFMGGQKHLLDKLTPTHLELKSGRRARVQYEWGKTPWLESRLQDFFGMTKGPAILDGKLPLTLHLLAPNQRAVQVTTDLPGFWERHYPDIRKELSRRYPRHKWPEDPR